MFKCRNEPSLAEALSDPLVQTIMEADHVDRSALEASLRATAQKVAQSRRLCAANEN